MTYFVASEIWRGGMVPDDNSRWFQMRTDYQTTVSEADAVLALVRLDLTGEIEKVALCQVCGIQWYVQKKRTFRFRGAVCRESYYVNHPDYHKRKAKAQQKYRRNKKLKEMAEGPYKRVASMLEASTRR